jgi:hypothetical protein
MAATVHYPLSPFYGKELAVYRRVGSGVSIRLDASLEESESRIAVPLWMTDRLACDQMQIGSSPHCSWEALLELCALIRSQAL